MCAGVCEACPQVFECEQVTVVEPSRDFSEAEILADIDYSDDQSKFQTFDDEDEALYQYENSLIVHECNLLGY